MNTFDTPLDGNFTRVGDISVKVYPLPHGTKALLNRKIAEHIEKDESSPDPNVSTMREFFKSIPTPVWVEVLAIAAATDERALEMMDVVRKCGREKVAHLAAINGVSIQELSAWVQNWYDQLNRLKMAPEVFATMRQIAKDASDERDCQKCKGTGEDSLNQPCVFCDGTGKKKSKPDHKSRRTLLEVAGLVGQNKGGVNVVTNINQPLSPAADLLGRVQSALNRGVEMKALEPAQDAEIVEPT